MYKNNKNINNKKKNTQKNKFIKKYETISTLDKGKSTIKNKNTNIFNNKISNEINKSKFNISRNNKNFFLDDSAYNIEFMFTARNKWRNNKNLETGDNMNEVLEIKDNLKIYKYCSNIKKVSIYKFLYQYKYDKFSEEDCKNANIILFIGKTGDGKTTAINAFFNIMKGIKLEDNYRYILIQEPKKPKGQAESQTDGLHLYYVKDKENKPIIIIDSQGFGDTRGKEYDELIFGAFEYAFAYIIDHINTVCFIAKSSEARLDILIRYIFSCATSLFCNNICQNFVILNTHASKSTIYEGPQFVESITSDEIFNEIIKKMDKKWWYAVESINILDNENDKLTNYSFKQLNEFYEEKVKNSKSILLKKSSDIISCRNKIKNIIKDIISKYHNINKEKQKFPEIDKGINECENKINYMDWKINNKKDEINYIYIPNVDDQISYKENEKNRKISELDNQYGYNKVRQLEYSSHRHTYCCSCKKNCHEYCDCFGGFLNRCYIFPVFGSYCEKCGCYKSSHYLYDHHRYVDKEEKYKINNDNQIQQVRDNFNRERDRIYEEYNRKKNEKEEKENELNNLNHKKSILINQKNEYINKKEKIKGNINIINKDLALLMLELKRIYQKIKDIAMNANHTEIENKYIESLIDRLEDIGDKTDQIKILKEFKKYNEIFEEIQKISEEELIRFGADYILDKLKI